MKRFFLISGLWLAATALSGAAAWGAVRLAGEGTAEPAVRPLSAAQVADLATGAGTTTTRPILPGPVPSGSSEAPGSTAPPPVTTSPVSSTPGSTSAAAGEPVAYRSLGGTVVVTPFRSGVVLLGATPEAGYSVEILPARVGEVWVEFEGDDHDSRVHAFVAFGEVRFEVVSGDEGSAED